MIIHLGFEIGVNKPITVNCLFLFAGATLVLGKGHLQPKGESPISRGQGYISKQETVHFKTTAQVHLKTTHDRSKLCLHSGKIQQHLERSVWWRPWALKARFPHTRSSCKLPNLSQGVYVNWSVVEKTNATVQSSSSRSLREKNPLPF